MQSEFVALFRSRDTRTPDRGRLGTGLRRVFTGADLHASGYARHVLLRARGEARPGGDELSRGRRRRAGGPAEELRLADVLLRGRGAVLDGARLRAVRADAARRRRTRGGANPQARDDQGDDDESDRRIVVPGGDEVRPRLRPGTGPGGGRRRAGAEPILLGRPLLDQLLGRPAA